MLENPLVAGAVLGGLGSLARAIIGCWNAHLRGDHFHAQYFTITVVLGLIIGIGLSLALEGNGYVKLIILLGGYGGTDFLEGLIRAVKILPQKH